jgi:hypothetical protein
MFNPPPHTQEITFDNKTKLTLRNVKKIEMGNQTHIMVEKNGQDVEYIVFNDHILFVKVYKQNKTDYE